MSASSSPTQTQVRPDAVAQTSSSTPFFITTIPRTFLVRHPTCVNNNNLKHALLPVDLQALEDPTPAESATYQNSIRCTNYSHFLPLISRLQHTSQAPITIPLPLRLCRLLDASLKVFTLTGAPSNLEAEDIHDALSPLLSPYFSGQYAGSKWFIRLDEASPKDTRFKTGPYTSADQIILALTTSLRVYRSMLRIVEAAESCETVEHRSLGEKLHLMPFREEINTFNEFRCFVPPMRFGGRVGAITQYSDRDVGWDPTSPRTWNAIGKLLDYIPGVFFKTAEEMGVPLPREEGFVVDIHIKEISEGPDRWNWQIEPLELNSFGAQLASGSSCLNWLLDWRRMYGLELEKDGLVEVRIVYGEEEGHENEVVENGEKLPIMSPYIWDVKSHGNEVPEVEEPLPVKVWKQRPVD
ncbi:hypothetical protein BJ508DRAFT_302994 [Ascobolus immersus RN42]|uniref:Uncharacterized protein n=1 Tax=Ascobolus immersus RN42 TaxID=1160509 RepID=A0A3N4IIS1_ASCIM|nr:hypothetical protein BJ508DRAFT_302994 [Ascobolus immersus RN42]